MDKPLFLLAGVLDTGGTVGNSPVVVVWPLGGRRVVGASDVVVLATVVLVVVVLELLEVVAAVLVTCRLALTTKPAAPQRTSTVKVAAGAFDGIWYGWLKVPLLPRVNTGPTPPGGKRAADPVNCVASAAGHETTPPLVGTWPEKVTVAPGAAVAGVTLNDGLVAAAAVTLRVSRVADLPAQVTLIG